MAKTSTQVSNFALPGRERPVPEGAVYSEDKRNNMKSSDTWYYDFDFYINYLTTLQVKSSQWTNYGYFDLGMVPVAMGPSSIHNILRPFIIDYCRSIGLKYYEMKSVSLLQGGYRPKDMDNDIWVFRYDLGRIIGVDELKVSVIDFLDNEEVKQRWEMRVVSKN